MTTAEPSIVAHAILEAVARGGGSIGSQSAKDLVAVFNGADRDGVWIGVYAVGTHGASLVESRTFPNTTGAKCRDLLRGLGVRVGSKYLGHPLVWVIDDLGCSVWSDKDIRVSGTGLELSLPNGSVHTSDVEAVVSFVDDDYIRRGVRLDLLGGRQAILVEEHDAIAEMDPTYGWDNFSLSDAHWVSKLGREFAAWLHVPHRNDAFPHDHV
jgi:hypothetical protein